MHVSPLPFSDIRIIELNGGQSPLTYRHFQMIISRMDPVEMPTEAITAEILSKCSMPIGNDHDERFSVPSLEELGKITFIYLHACMLSKLY